MSCSHLKMIIAIAIVIVDLNVNALDQSRFGFLFLTQKQS